MINKILCLIFVLLVFGFTAFDLAVSDRDFSEWENRELAQMPSLTVKTLLSGEFGSEYETYMTDQFAGRDTFVKAKFLADRALGKGDSGGVYITGDALYQMMPDPDYSVIDKSITGIQSFAKRTALDSYLMIVPSSSFIYVDKLPYNGYTVDEREIISYVEDKTESVTVVNIVDEMADAREGYTYFRTDHHWTSEGALIGYNAFREALGLTALTKEDFEITEVSDSFKGTLSSKSGALGIEDDILQRWDRGEITEVTVWNGVKSDSYSTIYFDEFLGKKDKYSYYLGTNQPIVTVKTDSDGGKLLVFKDSYAHIMTPLALGDWSEIVLVDLRYVRERADTLIPRITGLEMSDFDCALFMYSTETFITQNNSIWIK